MRALVLSGVLAGLLGSCTVISPVLRAVGIETEPSPSGLSVFLPYSSSFSTEACVRSGPSAQTYRELDIRPQLTIAAHDARLSEPPLNAPVLTLRLAPAETEAGNFPAGDVLHVRVRTKSGERLAPVMAIAKPLAIEGKLYYQPVVFEGELEQQLNVTAPLELWLSALEGEGCLVLEFSRSR